MFEGYPGEIDFGSSQRGFELSGINCNPHPKPFMNAENFSSSQNEIVCDEVADVLGLNRLVIMLPKCICYMNSRACPGNLRKAKGETSYDLY